MQSNEQDRLNHLTMSTRSTYVQFKKSRFGGPPYVPAMLPESSQYQLGSGIHRKSRHGWFYLEELGFALRYSFIVQLPAAGLQLRQESGPRPVAALSTCASSAFLRHSTHSMLQEQPS